MFTVARHFNVRRRQNTNGFLDFRWHCTQTKYDINDSGMDTDINILTFKHSNRDEYRIYIDIM